MKEPCVKKEKKSRKRLQIKKKAVPLHRICELSCGVTVAHRILVPFAWVRILPGQQLW